MWGGHLNLGQSVLEALWQDQRTISLWQLESSRDCDQCRSRMDSNTSGYSVRCCERVVFSSGRLAGWLRFLSTPHDAAGPHFIFWPWPVEFALCHNFCSAPPQTPKFDCSFGFAHCSGGDDAGLLLFFSMAEAIPSFFPNSRSRSLYRGRIDLVGMVDPMRLGLIAMSGVRAQNPELTALGLTLPGFVERNRVVASLPSLGLLTLAALTPQSVEVSYLEVPDLKLIDGIPGEFDVVAISSFSAQMKEGYELADRYRALGTKVILGGLHVSALPEEASGHAEAVVVGEGEVVWPQVISDLMKSRDNLSPIYDARGRNFDLSCAPTPRFELLSPGRYNRLTVQTQRGCPLRCEFCAASLLISPNYKLKRVEQVMTEIRRIKSLWDRPFIEFADDNTFVNKAHGKQLMRALEKEQIRWFTETDVSVAEDEELLGLMRDAGCAQVLIGFESTNFSGLDGLEQRSNWKAKKVDSYMQAIQRIQGQGITVNGCFVLGLDGTELDSFEQIWKFVRDSQLYDVQITVQTPFPGTPLYQRLRNEGRLLHDKAWELCTLFDVNFQPKNMTVSELEAGLRELGKRLYSEEFTRERRGNFFKNYRAARRLVNSPTKEVLNERLGQDAVHHCRTI